MRLIRWGQRSFNSAALVNRFYFQPNCVLSFFLFVLIQTWNCSNLAWPTIERRGSLWSLQRSLQNIERLQHVLCSKLHPSSSFECVGMVCHFNVPLYFRLFAPPQWFSKAERWIWPKTWWRSWEKETVCSQQSQKCSSRYCFFSERTWQLSFSEMWFLCFRICTALTPRMMRKF